MMSGSSRQHLLLIFFYGQQNGDNNDLLIQVACDTELDDITEIMNPALKIYIDFS